MKSKVLLIDDSVTIHRVIDLSIDFDRYDIVKVFSKEDAALKLQSEQFDYVLLDNKLDNIVVSDYISELKAQQPEASVILLVGAFDRFEEKDLEKSGADDYLVKPFDSQSLNAKLTSDANIMPEGLVEKIAEADQARDNDSFIAAAPAAAEHTAEKKITKEEYLDNLEETLPDDMTETGYADDDEKKESGGAAEEHIEEPETAAADDEVDAAQAPAEEPVPDEENIGVSEEKPDVSETAEETVEPIADETLPLPAEDEIAAAIPSADEPAAEELLPEEPADIDDNIEVAEETDTAAAESVPEEPAETVEESEESEAAPIEDEAVETPDTDDNSNGDEAGALPSDDIAGDVSEVAPDELSVTEDAPEEEPQEELTAAIPEDEPLAPEEPVLSEEIADEAADTADTPADSAEPDISDEAAAEPETENAPLFDDDDWLNDAPDTDTAAKPIQEEPAVSETAEEAIEPIADETLPAEDMPAADIPEQDDEADVPSDDEPAAEELLPEESADIDDNIEIAEETDTAADEGIPEEPAETVEESEESETAPIEDESVETPDTDGDIEGDEAGALPSDDIAGDVSEVASDELSEAEDTQEEEPQEESAPVLPQGLPDVKEADVMPDEPVPARFGGITVTISRDEIMSMLGNAIDKHFLEEAVKEVLARNMQDIVRNIVPAIAEKYIKEEIERLKNDE